MNKVWSGFILSAFFAALWQWLVNDQVAVFSDMMTSVFDMASLSIEIALGLVGLLCFWMGILKLAEASGALNVLSQVFSPLFHRLMPELPKNHPAFGHITMNMAANIFGLDNAATPAGIKAMESMQQVNPEKDAASNAQILFLVLNTSSVTLFPVTILMYRAQQQAAQPADVFIPIILATSASTLVGLLVVAAVQKINLFNRVVMSYLLVALLLLVSIIWGFQSLPPEQMASVSSALGNGILITAITAFVALALYKRVAVYEEFIEGAKQGFELAVKIMPYLVAMLVAIGLLRSSGLFDLVLGSIAAVVSALGGSTEFVAALPTGLMNPFSGSGARAMMLETMNTHGVDSFAGRLAAIFQGSTETTFYVLAVYFGAVNIRKLRHAIACGLTADLAGITAAIFIAYWFFG
ncbi:nucleoside recognition domain-containing protein [Pleionea mediterranea]|uniref:Spore maturation protein SpmA n=1 Tax=Pleionea mediterranea TaxID=523701 RepID=A0A316FU67_9GAMM|nr:spore maturation protein [Pleionea mediterranea]PWK51812.1 spore maturation protein SpmA [Pleionea mediterranea]